jgi:hypothetical protein
MQEVRSALPEYRVLANYADRCLENFLAALSKEVEALVSVASTRKQYEEAEKDLLLLQHRSDTYTTREETADARRKMKPLRLRYERASQVLWEAHKLTDCYRETYLTCVVYIKKAARKIQPDVNLRQEILVRERSRCQTALGKLRKLLLSIEPIFLSQLRHERRVRKTHDSCRADVVHMQVYLESLKGNRTSCR